MPLRLIKLLAFILAAFSLVMQVNRIWLYYTERLPQNHFSLLKIIGQHSQLFTYLSLPLIVLIILSRSRSVNTVYISLFVAAYCALGELPREDDALSYFLLSLPGVIVGNLFILSFQYFPTVITPHRIEATLTYRWMKRYLVLLLKPSILWIGMTLALFILVLIEYFFQALQSALSDFTILLTGLAYLFVNFRSTTGKEHDKILWLFWGLVMYILLTALFIVLSIFNPLTEVVTIVFATLGSLTLLFSFVMSMFFANAFDTNIFVRRTAVNAAFFLLAVFLYNTIEHFVLHWISHTLHVSDVMLSSVLSGVLVLCISPLHHRLTAFLNRKLKRKAVEH